MAVKKNMFAEKSEKAKARQKELEALTDNKTADKETEKKRNQEQAPEALVTANFKIPREARQKLKAYAAVHGTTSVALLLEWIAALPDVAET